MATAEALRPAHRSGSLRSYILVTAAYWADTLTDGAIRMLVLFYFAQLGFSPFAVASLFIFYEVFGVVTNLVGGYIAARLGLKATLYAGLLTQTFALAMLAAAPASWLTVPYVMVAQAFSGIAKDLTKMSSKSAIKYVVPEDSGSTLFKWVAILTGSKNALKGIGFFVGGLLLTLVGFQTALYILAGLVSTTLIVTAILMRDRNLGNANKKAKFTQMFSKNPAINMLSAARLFLFGSRDVWFVVGLPVFLYSVLGWNFWQVGGFLAIWVIGYGFVQAMAPQIIRRRMRVAADGTLEGGVPDGRMAMWLAFGLALFPAGIALGLQAGAPPTLVVVVGLIAFALIFAMNSAVHSYLILAYAEGNKVAMNVGFYYMANAGGRLVGTVLSGLIYVSFGLVGCLWASVGFVLVAGALSILLPAQPKLAKLPAEFGDGGE
jgi:MFS family permease